MEQIKNYYRWCRLRDICALRNQINIVRRQAGDNPDEAHKARIDVLYALAESMKKAYREDYPKTNKQGKKVNIDK